MDSDGAAGYLWCFGDVMEHHGLPGVGIRLRRARETRGLSRQDVARVTKIPPRALAAIEGERFDLLPGGIFRRSYIRAYADAVGLDGAACARDYVEAVEAPPLPATAEDLADWPGPAIGVAVSVALALVLLVVIVAVF